MRVHNIYVSVNKGIISHGLPIFAKYIPGKVWTILGRASHIAKDENISNTQLSFISLKEQLVYLVVGILISLLPIYRTYGLSSFFLIVSFSGIGISLVLFNRKIHELVLLLFRRFFSKELDLPLISFKNGMKLSLFNFFLWLSWTFGFYFLARSFTSDVDLKMAFVFPVSIVYGVLAIIMPGGLGVREGIITAFFMASGVSFELATSISVLARIWFIIGEVFIFVFAIILKIFQK